jgi:hypothetical protein
MRGLQTGCGAAIKNHFDKGEENMLTDDKIERISRMIIQIKIQMLESELTLNPNAITPGNLAEKKAKASIEFIDAKIKEAFQISEGAAVIVLEAIKDFTALQQMQNRLLHAANEAGILDAPSAPSNKHIPN